LFKAWEKTFEGLQASHEQAMHMLALGCSGPGRDIHRQRVILNDEHLFEVIGERPSGAQSAHACSHYDGLPTNVIRHAISADDWRAI
jgi:hypothetical protein